MLDLHSHVWGKDVVLQSEHLFLPKMKSVTTLMTAWAWGWHFLKPHNPVSPKEGPHIHLRWSYFFEFSFHSFLDKVPRLAFDPDELRNMII